MKNITDVNTKTFRKILMRPMKTVPMPPCRNRRYFKTTVLEKDLHQLMMDLGFKETTGRSKKSSEITLGSKASSTARGLW